MSKKNLPSKVLDQQTTEIVKMIADGYSNQQIADRFEVELAVIETAIDRPEVKVAISEMSAEVMASFGGSKTQIKSMLQRVIVSDLTDFYTDDGKMRPFSKIPVLLRQCITEIQFVHGTDSMGLPIVNTKIKTISKDKAIELLSRIDGLFDAQPDTGGLKFEIGYE